MMLNMQNILVNAFGFAVKFLVPAVVWITLIAGLYQLISGRVHRALDGLSGARKLTRRSAHELKPVS
jgi:hypothetical protein